jgi:hypothetical protein
MIRLPDLVLAELEGEKWEIKLGGRHYRLLIDGHQVVVLSNGKGGFPTRTHVLNTRSYIRRYKRKRDAAKSLQRESAAASLTDARHDAGCASTQRDSARASRVSATFPDTSAATERFRLHPARVSR